MSQLELENFYEKDKREYFLEDNQEFLHWYQGLERQGFVSSLSILQMQKLIDFISFYFEFKYPNTMLAEEDTIFANSEVYRKMKMISWSLDMEQFKYRLPLDYVDFLDCSYQKRIKLSKRVDEYPYVQNCFLLVSASGDLFSKDLESFGKMESSLDVSSIRTIEDLLNWFQSTQSPIDYSDLERVVVQHQGSVLLRNELLNLAALKLVYSRDTTPEFGYIRAKKMLEFFAINLGIPLDFTRLDQVMNIAYDKKDREECKKRQYLKMLIKDLKRSGETSIGDIIRKNL